MANSNLSKVPDLLMKGEASFAILWYHCTIAYLRQALVSVGFADLGKERMRGNGHMFSLEQNYAAVADRVLGWHQLIILRGRLMMRAM